MKKIYFILIIFPYIIKCSGCGVEPPLNSSYCFNRDEDADEVCCYLYNDNRKMCHLFPNKTILGENNITMNNELFNIECNFENSYLMGSRCGEENVTSLESCTSHSLINNPCCLYNNSFTGTLTCFHIGKITQTSLLSYDKDIINCYQKFIRVNSFLILFYFIFIGFL